MTAFTVKSISSLEQDLDTWLVSTENRRQELSDFARSPLPIDSSERHGELNALIRNEDDALRLAADIQSFLTQAAAIAILGVKEKYPDNSADERKILVKDAIRDIQRLSDGIAVTARMIGNRRFLQMNSARSRA